MEYFGLSKIEEIFLFGTKLQIGFMYLVVDLSFFVFLSGLWPQSQPQSHPRPALRRSRWPWRTFP